MSALQPGCIVTSYSEGRHAFTGPSAPTVSHVPGLVYDPLLDKLSWAQALSFLEALLK